MDCKADDLARLQYVMNELILVKLAGVDPDNSHGAWTEFLLSNSENQKKVLKVIYR
jgi:hypothetical protein